MDKDLYINHEYESLKLSAGLFDRNNCWENLELIKSLHHSRLDNLLEMKNTFPYYPVVLRELAKKIKKEAADNLITAVTNQTEYDIRKTIVSLLELPAEVEAPLETIFKNLKPKTSYYPDKIMFESLKKKYDALFQE